MEAAYVVLALVAGGLVMLALFNLSVPRAEGPARADSTRREAARSWRPQNGEPAGPAGRKVLLVGRSSTEGRENERLLREAGYDVRSCAGPEGATESFPYGGCLILNDEQCPLAARADAIVFGMELDSGAARSVLRGYRRIHPGTPVCVRTSDRESEWYARLLRDVRVDHGQSKEDIVAAVEHAVAARPAEGQDGPPSVSGPEGPSGSGRSAHDRAQASGDPSSQVQLMGKGRMS
jgi:hypothetical protein